MKTIQTPYASRTTDQGGFRPRLDPVVYEGERREDAVSLDAGHLQSYERDGYLFFERLFTEEEVLVLIEELERLKAHPERETDEAFITEPGSGAVRSVFEVHKRSDVFDRLSRDERVVRIAEQILGSRVYIHQSRVNLKPGFRGKEFYWHSDFETWHMEDGMPRMRALSCSITLTDNYAFNGPLMVIPGSHRDYVVCTGVTPENHYKQSLKKQEYGVPGDVELTELVKRGGIQMPTGPAGSVIFFDCNIMHGSNGNITPFPRTNAFFVYNSIENRLQDPFGGTAPRPSHIAEREAVEALQALPLGALTRRPSGG